jgi:Mrp family chromosome partitioning ATPase
MSDSVTKTTSDPASFPFSFVEGLPRAAAPPDRALAERLSPDAVAFEPFRVLRAKVKAIGEERPLRCLGVVAAQAGEGTMTTALGLAAALAQEKDRRVLLVEADLRTPRIAALLGLSAEPGLDEWLVGRTEGPAPVARVEPWGFFLLPAGDVAAGPGELVGSERMAHLLMAARQHFDTTVVVCPALTPFADTVGLQGYLDGLLVVIRARRTPRDLIRRALTHVKPGLVQGIVFNDRADVRDRWRRRRRPRSARS